MSYLVPIPSYFANSEYSKQRDIMYHKVRNDMRLYKYCYRVNIRLKFKCRDNKKVNPMPRVLEDWRF